jgi:hypothetical protein
LGGGESISYLIIHCRFIVMLAGLGYRAGEWWWRYESSENKEPAGNGHFVFLYGRAQMSSKTPKKHTNC